MIAFYSRLLFFFASFLALASRNDLSKNPLATPAPTTAALPAMRGARGMVARTAAGAATMAGLASGLAATAAELITSPPAPRAAVTPGARKRGCAEAVTRQTARVQAIKPWTSVCLQNMKSFWKTQTCLGKYL